MCLATVIQPSFPWEDTSSVITTSGNHGLFVCLDLKKNYFISSTLPRNGLSPFPKSFPIQYLEVSILQCITCWWDSFWESCEQFSVPVLVSPARFFHEQLFFELFGSLRKQGAEPQHHVEPCMKIMKIVLGISSWVLVGASGQLQLLLTPYGIATAFRWFWYFCSNQEEEGNAHGF